jgi:sugar transferase (PEP-CTERM/EpsH1 system associated)
MKKRPDILYLVHRVPYPPNRGDRIRSFHLLEFLAQRANIHLATLADEPVPEETTKALNERCRSVAIQSLGRSRWLHGAASLATGVSATEGLFWNRDLFRTVRNWSRETNFDAAVVVCSSMVQYLSIPELRDVPAIVDLIDVDSQKWFDYAAKTRSPKRWLYLLEGGRLRRLERRSGCRASAVVLVSEAEAELYRTIYPNSHTYGVPNGVDLEYFHPLPGEGRPGRCVFVGALDYRANIDGICWFCREVWPQIRAARPDATLAVVGRNPSAEVRQLSHLGGVEVFGSVPDVRPYLADASVAIAPLRIARGIQNKVLEAMASCRAVIASPEALEGLSVAPEQHVLCAASPGQWVEMLTRLMASGELRSQLQQSARAFVATNHSWQACLAPVGALLNDCREADDSLIDRPAKRLAQVSTRDMVTAGR